MHFPDAQDNESVMEVRILNDYGDEKWGRPCSSVCRRFG